MSKMWPEIAPTVLVDVNTKGAENLIGKVVDMDMDIAGYTNFLQAQGASDEQINNLVVIFGKQDEPSIARGIELGAFYTTNYWWGKDESLTEALKERSIIFINLRSSVNLSESLLHETSHFLDSPYIGKGRRPDRLDRRLARFCIDTLNNDQEIGIKKLGAVCAALTLNLVHITRHMIPRKVNQWYYEKIDPRECSARNFAKQHQVDNWFITWTAELEFASGRRRRRKFD